jgi:hypothetical protein
MNRPSTAPAIPPPAHPPPLTVVPAGRVEPIPTRPAGRSETARAEERRWLLMLGVPFAVSAALFAATIGSGLLWLLGPAMVVGPGLIILGFVYLGLTSDTEGTGTAESP